MDSPEQADPNITDPADEKLERERERMRDALRIAWESARPAWIALADAAWQLERIIERIASSLEDAGEGETLKALRVMAKRLYARIEEADVECLSPEGEPYTPDLANLFESIAQKPRPDTNVPVVLEVVEPAIMMRGTLIRSGRIITGIPGPGGRTEDAQSAVEGA